MLLIWSRNIMSRLRSVILVVKLVYIVHPSENMLPQHFIFLLVKLQLLLKNTIFLQKTSFWMFLLRNLMINFGLRRRKRKDSWRNILLLLLRNDLLFRNRFLRLLPRKREWRMTSRRMSNFSWESFRTSHEV